MKIMIVERNSTKADAFKFCFERTAVEVHCGEIFDFPADALVSPANSFGYMDGGIDAVYSQRWPGIQTEVQNRIQDQPFGELLVGQAICVDLNADPDFKFLIAAPTMRVPMKVPVYNAYLATRAAVQIAREPFNMGSLVFPGMGTGSGGIDPVEAGWAMRKGIRDGLNTNYREKLEPNWRGVAVNHFTLGERVKI
jgi:O-acetyl-ADP-ribose deacetylase (regulator of RNase III)